MLSWLLKAKILMTICVSKKTVGLIMACDLRSGAFASAIEGNKSKMIYSDNF